MTGCATQVGASWKFVAHIRLIRCDYDVMVASEIVILFVRVRTPLVTPNKFCPHRIMDNTLVYEAGDCGSIPYVGAI